MKHGWQNIQLLGNAATVVKKGRIHFLMRSQLNEEKIFAQLVIQNNLENFILKTNRLE